MAGGKGMKNKRTAKVKTAKKTAPAGQRKKMAKTGKNASKAGMRTKTVKPPGKHTTAAPRTSKPKTAKPPGKKIMNVKPMAWTNVGVGPSSKPTKKRTNKVQANVAFPGTSQNTGQTTTKQRAAKRKPDQPNQAAPSNKKMRFNIPGPAAPSNKKMRFNIPGPAAPSNKKMRFNIPGPAAPSNKKMRFNIPGPAAPSNKKMRFNIPGPEVPRFQEKRNVNINVVHAVQPNPHPFQNTSPVQVHHHHYQKREDFQNQEGTRPKAPSVLGYKANNHFVDRHREALISRVSPVGPILDSLMSENLLSDEQYANIRSKETSQEQMRELLKYTRGMTDADKDKVYEAVKKHNGPQIQDLALQRGAMFCHLEKETQ